MALTQKALAEIVTTLRATTGTVIDASGKIATVPADTARIDYSDGEAALLEEAASTNLVPYSAASIDNWLIDGATLTGLSLNALGTFPGLKIASDGQSYHRASAGNVNWTSGNTYAVSAWYKAGTSGKCRVVMRDSAGAIEVSVSGLVGALSLGSSAGGNVFGIVNTALGDGLYKVTFLFTPNTSTTSGRPAIGPHTVNVGEDVVALGIQVEAGTVPTSYIPTNGGAVTRARDICTVDVSDLGIAAGCTIAVKGRFDGLTQPAPGTNDRILSIDDGGFNNRLILASTNLGAILAQVRKDNILEASSNGPDGASTSNFAVAMRAGPNNFKTAINGVLSGQDSSVNYPAVTTMRIGASDASGGGTPPRLRVKSILIYPVLLSDAALAALGTV
ncbi:phage head spike fiber domain-containing protein [Phaeovulum sp. W22_SRMD_FR3]|uniref:phage head spike fiber domain-containing protein n=1 Tax=Phaeovulum sp. W22_SRMD_FR3 TaxID=3240274 RepID=UPI003F9818FD